MQAVDVDKCVQIHIYGEVILFTIPRLRSKFNDINRPLLSRDCQL